MSKMAFFLAASSAESIQKSVPAYFITIAFVFFEQKAFRRFMYVAHRSRMNPSRSKIIVQPILLDTNTKVIWKDSIDTRGLRFE